MPVEIVAVPARASGHPHLAEMIERHYGALLDGAHAGIAGRLDALEPNSSRPLARRPRTFRALVGHAAVSESLGWRRILPLCCGFVRRAREDSNLRPAD
jgi:hypothetical protein